MSRSSPPPEYHRPGDNVLVATAHTPGNRDQARARPKPASGPAQAVIDAYCTARIDAVAGEGKDSRGVAQANMRRQLAADGIKPAA